MKTRSQPLAILTLLGLAACAAPPVTEDWGTRSPELTATNPNNITVLNVEDATQGRKATRLLPFIRLEIQRALPQRCYAPLNSVVIDAHVRAPVPPGSSVVDAGYLKSIAGKVDGEEAILAVRVKHWDESTLLVNNRVRLEAEAVLYGSRAHKILWQGGLRGEVVAGGGKAPPRDPEPRARAAALEFVSKLVTLIPEHHR